MEEEEKKRILLDMFTRRWTEERVLIFSDAGVADTAERQVEELLAIEFLLKREEPAFFVLVRELFVVFLVGGLSVVEEGSGA